MKKIRIDQAIYRTKREKDFFPIDKWLLDVNDVLTFDIYAENETTRTKELLLLENEPLSAAHKIHIDSLHYLYIRREDITKYNRFIESVVQSVAQNSHIAITKKAAVIYRQAAAILDEMFDDPEALENIPKSKKVVDRFVETIFSDKQAIESLMKITTYDYYTHTHSINVCIYALSLGSYLGLEEDTLEELGVSALLHDLGKSKVDPKITNKLGRLSDGEFEQMKHHPVYGHQIAIKIGIKDSRILDGIRHHHEKLDGSGYPDAISGDKITLFARIIGVCDVFDALSTKRPYKDRMSSYESLKLMKETMQSHLDIEMIDAFIRMQRHGSSL